MDNIENTAASKKADEKLLNEAKERFRLSQEAESEYRALALEDLKFRAGEQWPQDVKQQRDMDRRPCLTVNRIPQFVRQITNGQRQNRPAIKVSPVDDKGDVETAKILQGLIRHIEYNSSADAAYDTAFESAVTHGRGFFRILTDYCDPLSFEQDILFKRVRNPFTVYMDPNSTAPDGSDMEWCFVIEDVSKDEFKRLYPKAKMSAMQDWQSLGDSQNWCTRETARVAEYFYREFEPERIYLIATQDQKSVVTQNEIERLWAKSVRFEIIDERKTMIPKIRWCKINGVEVLEETEFPGCFIPIIPVLGEELDIEGKRVLEGIIRHAKDPQRMLNYWVSSETETIALAPRAPFIGVEGQFEGHEDKWKTANVRNHAFLEYKPKTIGGQMAPAPQRNVFEPPIQAITQARMQAADDIKATTGIYDAALGARSNENSGVAIQRRKQQSETSNFHFVDNLTRSLRHAGRIIIDLIPEVYDTARAIRTIGEDGEETVVQINQLFQKNGEVKAYHMGVGKYDVTVDTGPSYATKRQEALDSMLELTRVYPQAAQVAGDLMVRNMDWPGARDIADRLKKTLPPGIAEDPEKGQPQIPPEMQAQMQQMGQQIDGLTQQLNQAHEALEKKTVEIESKERIEFAKMEVDLKKEMLKLDSQEAIALLRQELGSIHQRLNLLGMNEPVEEPQHFNQQSFYNPQPMGPSMQGPMPFGNEPPTGGLSPGLPVE